LSLARRKFDKIDNKPFIKNEYFPKLNIALFLAFLCSLLICFFSRRLCNIWWSTYTHAFSNLRNLHF